MRVSPKSRCEVVVRRVDCCCFGHCCNVVHCCYAVHCKCGFAQQDQSQQCKGSRGVVRHTHNNEVVAMVVVGAEMIEVVADYCDCIVGCLVQDIDSAGCLDLKDLDQKDN